MGKSSETMTVSWSTASPAASDVVYGLSSKLEMTAHGNSTTYTTKTVPRAEKEFTTYSSPVIHHVQLTGLAASTTYYYRAGAVRGSMSTIASFRTPPAKGDATPLVTLVVGDLGQTEVSCPCRIQCICPPPCRTPTRQCST